MLKLIFQCLLIFFVNDNFWASLSYFKMFSLPRSVLLSFLIVGDMAEGKASGGGVAPLPLLLLVRHVPEMERGKVGTPGDNNVAL